MVARLPSLCRVWVVISYILLAAKAAGNTVRAGFGKKTSHRAILRHAVLVHHGRCAKRACVLVLFSSIHVRCEGSGCLNWQCMGNVRHTITEQEKSPVSTDFGIYSSKNRVVFMFANVG